MIEPNPLVPKQIWVYVFALFYVSIVALIIHAVHYRYKTSLGVRDNDKEEKYLCYHRANDENFPYWTFVVCSSLAPFRLVIFVLIMFIAWTFGNIMGIFELILGVARQDRPEQSQCHWTVRTRAFTDQLSFRLMLACNQYHVRNYEIVQDDTVDINHHSFTSHSESFLAEAGTDDALIQSNGTTTHEENLDLYHREATKIIYLSQKELYRRRITGALSSQGTMLANHISVWDAFVFGSLCTSFVAFADFVPHFIKFYGRMNQVIFLDVKDKKSLQKVKNAIGDHQRRMRSDPITTAPLMMFPEGTTTTGRCIMPLKDGAFEALEPVQPIIMKYSVQNKRKAYDTWSLGTDSTWQNLLISLADFRSNKLIELIWMPKMTPERGETFQVFKERVYIEMNLLLEAIQPDALKDLPVWYKYSKPHTHKFKHEASEYQLSLWNDEVTHNRLTRDISLIESVDTSNEKDITI